MRTELALQIVAEHQARILAHIEASCAMLASGPDAAREGLAKARWTLSRLLREYQLFKHGEIFDPAIARGSAGHAAIARRMKANCIAAGEHYAVHVARWSVRDVAAQWTVYSAAVLAVADDIRGHLARERRDVERFLAGSTHTRQLAPRLG